ALAAHKSAGMLIVNHHNRTFGYFVVLEREWFRQVAAADDGEDAGARGAGDIQPGLWRAYADADADIAQSINRHAGAAVVDVKIQPMIADGPKPSTSPAEISAEANIAIGMFDTVQR